MQTAAGAGRSRAWVAVGVICATACAWAQEAPPASAAASAPAKGTPLALTARLRAEPNAVLRRELLAGARGAATADVEAAAAAATEDADPTVVIEALDVIRLGRFRNQADRLVQTLSRNRRRPDGYGPAIRESAMRALGACGGASAVPALVAELERHEDLGYDTVAVTSLGEIGDRSALAAVDAFIARLETLKPKEAIALEPWQRAMAAALEARQRVQEKR